MFGIKFIKVQPTTYLLQYRGGKIVREGVGMSFFYYAPTTSLVAVPGGSTGKRFIFQAERAGYARRNSALEQERASRKNKLNTEIAVENKKRQIRETQMEAERSVQ